MKIFGTEAAALVSKMVPGCPVTLRRSISPLILALLWGFSKARGQLVTSIPPAPASQNAKKYTVTGIVVNSVTGEPIRRAVVHINGVAQFSSFTGPDGRFEMGAVPEGQVFVTAEKPGYFDQHALHSVFYSSQVNSFQLNSLTVGPGANELRVPLTPEAKIRGHVVDSEGEPIAQVSVQLLAEDIIEGRRQVQNRAGTMTDDDGAYQLDGLVPGRYWIRTGAHPVSPASWNGPLTIHPAQFYPNAPDRLTAPAIEVRPGEQFEADFTLREVPGFSISGILAGAQNGVSVSLEEEDGLQVPAHQWRFDQRTGHFVLRGVPSGTWNLLFTSNDSQGNTYCAQQDVRVNASDISDLQVVLQRAPDIPVIVNHPSAVSQPASGPQTYVAGSINGPVQGPGVTVQLIPSSNSSNQRFYAAPQPEDPQGALSFRGVPPGRYRVLVQAFGPECVDSISMGSVDLTRSDFMLAPGSRPEPIAVSLQSDCGSITGTIRSDSPNVQGFAVLVPDSPVIQPQAIPIQPNGVFFFGNLRPGSYRVYAFSDVQDLEYANPEVLNSYTGQQITLGANEKVNVSPELVVRKVK